MAKPAIYTVAQVAQELGVTPTTIYSWLKAGRLKRADVEVHGRLHLVDAESVERLKAKREEANLNVH